MQKDSNDTNEEPRKYLVSENATKWIARIVIGSVILIFVAGAIYITTMNKQDRTNSIANQEVHDVVLEIEQQKNDVPWYKGRMGNGDWITLNRPMVYKVAVGDSIIKEKGQDFFTLKKKGSNQISTWKF